jgi:Predicted transporter component
MGKVGPDGETSSRRGQVTPDAVDHSAAPVAAMALVCSRRITRRSGASSSAHRKRQLGVSGNLRTICAALMPRDIEFFKYDWKRSGSWNLAFAAGILAGGFVGGYLLASPQAIALSPAAQATFHSLGLHRLTGLVPVEIFSFAGLMTLRGIVIMIGGGFLIGFGAAYAGGCTSGHGISGVADLQLPSFIAVAAMFGAGMLTSWFIVPLVV